MHHDDVMAERKDVSRCALTVVFIILNLMVKEKCFVKPDGISITLNENDYGEIGENYIYSSLFSNKSYQFKPKRRYMLFLLLLVCGDIESQPGPYRNIPELKGLCSQKGLKICHQNIRGLQGKFDEVSQILNNNKIEIFFLSELFLNNINSKFIIPGYEFLRKDRKTGSGGGVGIFIRTELNYKRRRDLEEDDIESIFIEIFPKNSKSFVVGTIYRPPDSSKHLSKNFDTVLSNLLKDMDSTRKEIIILGDINVDYLKTTHQSIKDAFILNGFSQLINAPTRVTETTATLIDVIQTNCKNNISYSTVIPAGLSDHDLIGCVRKMNNVKYQPITIHCRDYKNYNVDAVNNELLNKDWNLLYQMTSPVGALSYFTSILKETLDKHATFITKQIKGKPSPWMTKELTREMNIRDQLLRKARKTNKTYDWDVYKRKRNFVKNQVQRLKRNHFKTQLEENATKPDRFWKIVNDIYSTKSKSETTSNRFTFENETVTSKQEIANGFCKFFSTIANKLKSKAFPFKNLVWGNKKAEVYFEKHQFQFKEVTGCDILKRLKGLKRKCAVGLDEISASFLKDTAFVIAKPLAHVINLSLKHGIFPAHLSKAKVTPIFKSGNKESFDNYRPISVLSAISKIFEKCVHSQIMDHLENNKLLSTQQFGYRRRRSTDLASVCFLDQIRQAMDEGKLTGAVYVDLSKAFDTIGHNAIIQKLPKFGITGIPQKWFCSYLFGRYQHVSYQNTLSTAEPIYCGVPQGSILGPLLFLLHFNDAANVLTKCKIVKYADDTVLFYSHKDSKEIESVLNCDFNYLCHWLEENELIINCKKGKSEVMLFGTIQRLKKSPPLKIERNNCTINDTQQYKYLGLNVNPTLNMSKHVEFSLKKAVSRINLLKSMRALIDSDVARKIYGAMILPILTNYPFSTYGTISKTLRSKIKSTERRAQRIVGHSAKLPSSESVQKICIASFVHRCVQKDVCQTFEKYFKLRSTNSIKTRNSNIMVELPRVKLEVARKSFYFQGANLYNELPREIRLEKSFTKFKSLLKLYFTD